jgi:hypothetical protein
MACCENCDSHQHPVDLGLASNMFGKLDPEVQERLAAVIHHQDNETWEDAHSIVLRDTGLGLTLWQAVIAVDPSFPKRGPSYTAGHTGRWDRIPSADLIRQAINYATR